MIRIARVPDPGRFASRVISARPGRRAGAAEAILEDVRRNGDAAVRRYEKKFGGARISSLRVPARELERACSAVGAGELAALRLAKSRLERTERATRSLLRRQAHSSGGIRVSRAFAPIPSVGCYVPGGLAKYPSSVIMSVVPAKVAGVRRIAVATPPNPDGSVDPLTLAAARLCGADEVYRTGGVQAIGAMAYGTRSVPRVDKIVGPGGALVTSAKHLASGVVGIDMLAGPTELGIMADGSADPRIVALDLVSQAEHGCDTLCYVITDSQALAKRVDAALAGIVPGIEREGIVRASLSRNGFIAVCRGARGMAELAEALAPEHLQVMTGNPAASAAGITSPGLVLLGKYTPSAASDYIMGSNHILPTCGFGRSRGSLSVLDFVKLGTTVSASRASLAAAEGHMGALAGAEGLPNHHGAVRGRLR